MTFEEYLASKKIDGEQFKKSEPTRWQEWNTLFSSVHPNSFTVQKLNLINKIRRNYTLKERTGGDEKETGVPKPTARSVMKPKFK